MGYSEAPPYAGEIPNTLLAGVMPIGGIIHTPLCGEYPIGPVRRCGVIPIGTRGHINDPGALGEIETGIFGDLETVPARSCGLVDDPPVIGDSSNPPCKGSTGMPGCVGWIDQT